MKTVGLFMPCWNSADLLPRAATTLRDSISRSNLNVKLIVIDGGSTDGSVEWLRANDVPHVTLTQPRKNGLNEAVWLFAGNWDKDKGQFAKNDLDYLGFVHTDADYSVDPAWLRTLVEICEKDPGIGCIGPAHNSETKALPPGEHVANCPIFILPMRVIREFYGKYGWWIDPNFWTGTSYCDWDMQWNLKALGYRSVVTTRAHIDHFCNGTRAKLWVTEPDFRRRDLENKDYYHSKWPAGVSPF